MGVSIPFSRYDPFIISQIASRDQVQGVIWCKFGHIPPPKIGPNETRVAHRVIGVSSRPQVLGCYVTKFAPHKALKLIARGKLTFDERVVVHRAVECP